MKFDIQVFFPNLSRTFMCHLNPTSLSVTLLEDLCAVMILSRWFLLRMRNVSDKSCREVRTHILCSITLFRKLLLLWDNVEKYVGARGVTDDNIIRRVHIACWITKATDRQTDTHTHTHTHTHTYSGPLTYELNSFPRAGRNSRLFFP
jgi:hypothetical protein